MRLSFLLELLLIFVLLAFAASRVIENGKHTGQRQIEGEPSSNLTKPAKPAKPAKPVAEKFCSCAGAMCNCCRNFVVPVLGIKGPGCASLQYAKGDNMIISMSFADRVITNTTISGRKPEPVCMPLPGGVSKFCGRVYNIGRQGEDFKACLGLELRALSNIEAAMRVSCFKFGPNGMKLEPAQPLPVIKDQDEDGDDDDEDDDDDDDDFDLDEDVFADDDDEDDDEELVANDADGDSPDYAEFSVFGDDILRIFESEYDDKKKPVSKNKVRVTTRKPQVVRRPTVVTKRPVKVTKAPVKHKNTKLRPTTKRPKVRTPAPSLVRRTTVRPTTTTSAAITTVTPVTEAEKITTTPTVNTSEDKKFVPTTNTPISEMTTNLITVPSTESETKLNTEKENTEKAIVTTEMSTQADISTMTINITNMPPTKTTLFDDEDDEEDDGPVPNFIIKNDDDSSNDENLRQTGDDDTDYEK